MSLDGLNRAIDLYRDEIEQYAIIQHPREACGLITRFGFIPRPNVSDNPHRRFILGGEDYDSVRQKYRDKNVVGIFHSHVNGREKPSPHDLACCEQLGIPWALFTLPNKTWTTFEPSGYMPPLVGRPWVYGVLDCYSVIRDAYKQADIYLDDFVRAELYAWNKDPNWDMYSRNFDAQGFYLVQKPQPYDLIAMKVESDHGKINHCGLYLGGGDFLHHLINKVSERTEWKGFWRKVSVGFYRHEDIENAWETPIKLY